MGNLPRDLRSQRASSAARQHRLLPRRRLAPRLHRHDRAPLRSRERWSIYWTDSGRGVFDPPVVGRFTEGVGVFEGDDRHDGVPVRVRFIWSHDTPRTARWEQAFSADGGATWETNWIMSFTRAE